MFIAIILAVCIYSTRNKYNKVMIYSRPSICETTAAAAWFGHALTTSSWSANNNQCCAAVIIYITNRTMNQIIHNSTESLNRKLLKGEPSHNCCLSVNWTKKYIKYLTHFSNLHSSSKHVEYLTMADLNRTNFK